MDSQNQVMFDTNKISAEIQNLLPDIDWKLDSGFDYISMTYQNDKNPRFPLIISINEEEGIFVDLSQCGGVLECHTNIPEVIKLISDILNDKIIVALAYPDEDKFEKQILSSMMRTFYFEDAAIDDEDDQLEFTKFLSTVSKPRTFLSRLNVFAFHGVIEISNWSGSTYYKLYRK
jgi:hypothetical protein